MIETIPTWRERLGLGDAYPLHAPTDVERAMVAEIAELRAQSGGGPLVAAVRRLVKCKGRHHTELNYTALVAALDAYEAPGLQAGRAPGARTGQRQPETRMDTGSDPVLRPGASATDYDAYSNACQARGVLPCSYETFVTEHGGAQAAREGAVT